MGADRRDQIRADRYKPYSYQSNSTTLLYVGGAIALWIVLSLWLAWTDRSNIGLYEEWQAEGMTVIPPTGTAPDDLLAYAAAEHMPCNTVEEINTLTPGCVRVLEIRRDFVNSQDVSNLIFAGLVVSLVMVAFPFSTFIARASRNLLALRSKGQKFSPEWAVLWLFIPIMNAVRPIQVFRELFRGSDPELKAEDEAHWQRRGKVPLILYAWWPLFVGSLFFNPIFIPRVWHATRENIADLVATSNLLFWSEILVALTGLAAFFMLRELHRRQETRHAEVGDLVVQRPGPTDHLSITMTGNEPEAGESANGENR